MRYIQISRRFFSLARPRPYHNLQQNHIKCELNPAKCQVVPCCMKMATNFNSDPGLLPEVDDKVWRNVVQYAKYKPKSLTLDDFIRHGQYSDKLVSYNFLRSEIPIRLAGLILEFDMLPGVLQKQVLLVNVRDSLLETFNELVAFKSNPSDSELDRFDEALVNIRSRHADLVSTVAEAVMEAKFEQEEMNRGADSGIEGVLTNFLDRLYMTRISVRMLYNQHLYVFGGNISKPRHVGQINPYCDVSAAIRRAYDEAGKLCELHYGQKPEILISSVNKTANEAEDVPIMFAYVPSHLHHMVFEVMKNSMRATVEQAVRFGTDVHPIKVLVSKTDSDITIKISDNGGGVPRSAMDNLFKYMYTTAGRVGRAHQDMVRKSEIPPMAGLGYGLPLSRLYARYFQGDLDISSVHGIGTDCFIYLRSMESNAPEHIPIHSASTEKTYIEKSIRMSDWTGDICNTCHTVEKDQDDDD